MGVVPFELVVHIVILLVFSCWLVVWLSCDREVMAVILVFEACGNRANRVRHIFLFVIIEGSSEVCMVECRDGEVFFIASWDI